MSGLIPRDFIHLLLNRTEIVDLIDGRIPLRKKSGNNFFACCPFHNEKSPSFSVSQNKQFFHCFGCGAHGNAIDFLMQFDHLSFPEAVESLAKQANLEVPREKASTEKTVSYDNLYELLNSIAKFYQAELRKDTRAINYLKQRGVSGVIAKEFELGFAPLGWEHVLQTFGKTPTLKQELLSIGMLIQKEEGGFYDRFRDRIIFPIHDKRGRVVGFGGRILEKGEPKYLNSPETPVFQKGKELYGLYHALKTNRQLKQALIVEGYMDVIALFQQGITYAIATLGTATTAHHLQRLFRYTSNIIFCFDGDDAGRTAAARALQVVLPLMQDGIQVRFLFLPDKEDPDSLVRKEGKDNFEKRMQSADTLSHFFFQSIAVQVDMSSMDGRASFVELARKQIEQLPKSIFQEMMLEELAKRARIDVKKLQHPTKAVVPRLDRGTQKARTPSALRLAMMLLVQQPSLAFYVNEPLPSLEMKGFGLFSELFSFIKENTEMTTAVLLEFWREREEAATLVKFAQMEHMIPEAGIQKEFLGAIQRLKKLANKQAVANLLAKANQADLTAEEKQELNNLISER